MSNDYSGMFGMGIGFFLIFLVIYLAILALFIWIGYLILRTAVKNGVLLAMRDSGQMFAPRPPYPGAQPPQGTWGPNQS